MPRGVQELNELYCDLMKNSPQTMTKEIPTDLGTGFITQTATKQGVILSDWQMKYLSDVTVQGRSQDEYIQIIFCMKESISWEIPRDSRSVNIRKGEACIYKGHGQLEHVCYGKNRDFSFRSIKIPVSYFSKLLDDYFGTDETRIYKKKLYHEVSTVAVTPSMERLLAETKDFGHYRGGLGHLYLDGKVFELLAIYLSDVLEADILANKNYALSRTERASLSQAKQIIDSQLACAPSCEELCKLVHLSMTKLTKGFADIYGTTVHAYIIDQRLERAAGLLLESSLNVSQVSAIVGYSKASNFAAAFKKKYGVVPKEYRDAQIVDD